MEYFTYVVELSGAAKKMLAKMGIHDVDLGGGRTMTKEKLIGKKVKIIHMHGEPQYDGKTGVVTDVDDADQIHGTWGGCALCAKYGDKFIVEDQNRRIKNI